jgi:hypothetical protein
MSHNTTLQADSRAAFRPPSDSSRHSVGYASTEYLLGSPTSKFDISVGMTSVDPSAANAKARGDCSDAFVKIGVSLNDYERKEGFRWVGRNIYETEVWVAKKGSEWCVIRWKIINGSANQEDIAQVIFKVPEADDWKHVYRVFAMLTSQMDHKELLQWFRKLEEQPVGWGPFLLHVKDICKKVRHACGRVVLGKRY